MEGNDFGGREEIVEGDIIDGGVVLQVGIDLGVVREHLGAETMR